MNIFHSFLVLIVGLITAPFSFFVTQPPQEVAPAPVEVSTDTPEQATTVVVTKTDALTPTYTGVFKLPVTQSTTTTKVLVVPAPEPVVPTPDVQVTPTEAVGGTMAPMPPLECSFSAELVTFSQGTKHAKFTWNFPAGATGTIRQDGVPYNPQTAVRYAPGSNIPHIDTLLHSSDLMEEVFSGNVEGGESFTLTVEKDGQTVTCQASV